MARSVQLSSGVEIETPFKWLGVKYPLAELKPEEEEIFTTQFEGLLGTVDSVVRNMFRDRKDFIEIGIMAIKAAMSGSPEFTGIYPNDNELGMALIRPMHVGATDSSPEGKTSWSETVTAANTRQAWMGASTSDMFTVGGYASDKTAGWGGLIMLGVGSLSLTQVINEIKFWNDREERVPVNVEDISLGDNINQVPVYPIPTEIYLPKSGMYAELNGVTTGVTEYFKIYGLTIGLGKLLKRTTFA